MANAEQHRINPSLVEFAIAALKLNVAEISVVQIGANDGQFGDPIFPHVHSRHPHLSRWKGWLFEPVPVYYERLVKNYASKPDMKPFNMAVSNEATTRTIYYLDPAREGDVKGWGRAIASFDRAHLSKHLDEDMILEKEVPCLPFDQFAAEHDITSVDLFVIDVEGHERAVLSTVDLKRYAPKLVILEHGHLSDEDRSAIVADLEAVGLLVLKGFKDLVAMDPRLIDPKAMADFLE